MDGWNTTFLLGWPICRCYVSFREGRCFECGFSGSISLRSTFVRINVFFQIRRPQKVQQYRTLHRGLKQTYRTLQNLETFCKNTFLPHQHVKRNNIVHPKPSPFDLGRPFWPLLSESFHRKYPWHRNTSRWSGKAGWEGPTAIRSGSFGGRMVVGSHGGGECFGAWCMDKWQSI